MATKTTKVKVPEKYFTAAYNHYKKSRIPTFRFDTAITGIMMKAIG